MNVDFAVFEERRTDAYAAALEARLRAHLVDGYARRAGEFWKRDYTSVEAYLRSVEPGREGWRRVVRPPDLARAGPARAALPSGRRAG